MNMEICESRNIDFDVMKGIGVILMITAHTLGPESITWNYIYAFHMPLFFITSGYFFREKDYIKNANSLYTRLIKPYIFICISVTILRFFKDIICSGYIYVDNKDALYGMGPGWFLLALFWGKNIFNAIIKQFPRSYMIISLIISSIPILINNSFPLDLPSEILQGLSCIIFIAIGYYAKQKNILIKLTNNYLPISLIISLLLWINTSIFGKVEVATCTCKLWIIDYLGATGGTFLCYYLSSKINKFSTHVTQILTTISQYSLAIISFHAIDFCIPMWYLLSKYIDQDILLLSILVGRFIVMYLSILVTNNIPILYHLFMGNSKEQ